METTSIALEALLDETTGDVKIKPGQRPPDYDTHIRLRAVEKKLRRMEVVIYLLLGAQLLGGNAGHEKVVKLLKLFIGAE